MNRQQRRAASRGRGQFLEVCLDGSCFAHAHGPLGSQAEAPPFVKGMGTRVTDDGYTFVTCPWCDGDVNGKVVPGEIWDCPSCGAFGMLAPAYS